MISCLPVQKNSEWGAEDTTQSRIGNPKYSTCIHNTNSIMSIMVRICLANKINIIHCCICKIGFLEFYLIELMNGDHVSIKSVVLVFKEAFLRRMLFPLICINVISDSVNAKFFPVNVSIVFLAMARTVSVGLACLVGRLVTDVTE